MNKPLNSSVIGQVSVSLLHHAPMETSAPSQAGTGACYMAMPEKQGKLMLMGFCESAVIMLKSDKKRIRLTATFSTLDNEQDRFNYGSFLHVAFGQGDLNALLGFCQSVNANVSYVLHQIDSLAQKAYLQAFIASSALLFDERFSFCQTGSVFPKAYIDLSKLAPPQVKAWLTQRLYATVSDVCHLPFLPSDHGDDLKNALNMTVLRLLPLLKQRLAVLKQQA